MSDPGTAQPIDILLVEDSPADVRLTQESFRETKLLNQLHVVTDGVQAMEFLRRENGYEDAPRPHLILLDLNLPRMTGQEVLGAIKADDSLRRIPVVVLTTSRAEEDILKTYDLHANCFVSKPFDYDKFGEVVRTIEQFWVSIVRLPPTDN